MKKHVDRRTRRIMGTVDPRLLRIMRDYASYNDLMSMGYSKDSTLMKELLQDIKETIKTIGD